MKHRRVDRLSFQSRLVIGSFGITAVLMAVGFMVYRSITTLIADTAWVNHTHDVIGTLNEISSLLKDAETSQRGYLITGQLAYLGPYQKALPRIETCLAKIKGLTADNSLQQVRAIALQSAIQTRMASLRETLLLRQLRGFEAAQRRVLSGEGKREMDRVRALIDEMSGEERHLLKQRSHQAQTSARFAL